MNSKTNKTENAKDIHDAKRDDVKCYSSAELLRSEAVFRIIFDNLAWCVTVFDEKGCLIDINEAGLKLFGTTKEKMLGIRLFDSPNLSEAHKAQLRKGELAEIDLLYDFGKVNQQSFYKTMYSNTVKYIRGKCIPLKDEQGQVFGFLYWVYDDTENHLKNDAIQANLAKIKAAIDTGSSYLWEFDLHSKKLVADFSLVTDSASETLMERFWHDVSPSPMDIIQSIHPDDVSTLYASDFQRLKIGETDHFTSVFRRILNGKTYWFTANIRTYKWDENGQPEKIVCYTSDITRQKEKEIELFKAKEADKLRSAFMANMSHEIRTPLNAIVGFSNILVEMNSTPETEFFREAINKNNSLLLKLVDDILDFSRIEMEALEFKMEYVPVKELCDEVINIYEPMVKEGVNICFTPENPVCVIRTDRKRLQQVISQLMGNAVKYTTNGYITLSYYTNDSVFTFKVADTGIGIPEKNRESVFDCFYQVDHFHQGTGLGLSIAKSLIERLGGTIGVDSIEGQGSTFWFTLPVSF